MGRWSLVFALACKGPSPAGIEDNFGVLPDRGQPGCENLAEGGCLYPFPSAAFVDAGQLNLPVAGLPVSNGGDFDPAPFRRFTAFGAASPILFQLPGAAPDNGQVFDPAPSLRPDAKIIVLDAATGERVPHWVEGDFLSAALDPPLFVIRPAVPLPRGTEVVVGVRGLTGADGRPVPAPEGFAALRDQAPAHEHGVHERRAAFEQVVFPTLQAAGWSRDELQLAWSFPVRAQDQATARLLAVRDAIFAALPPEGPDYTLDAVLDCPGTPTDPEGCHPDIRTIVDGTVLVPSVVLPPDALGVRALRLDPDGRPVVDGVEAWPFRLQLPHAAYEDEPARVLQYGHGFLGRRAEANNGWIRALAQRQGLAILATDMQGMHQSDMAVWLDVLAQDGGRFPELAELPMQGVVNQLVQQRLVRSSLATDPHPSLWREDGRLAWDPDTVWYHGNSQGGSVGTLVMALSTDVTRADLGVPGSGYPLLLHRSSVFSPFVSILQLIYPEPDSVTRFLVTLGTAWDDVDPLTFAPHLHADPLPGTPAHEVLLHVAKEDRQVHNQASFILGRAAGAALMVPAVRPVFGLPELPYPASPGVGLVEVDFGIPEDPTPADPPDGDPTLPDQGDTHGWLRRWQPAQDQMVHFLATGELVDVCGGQPCVTDGPP